ncbi:MAG: hypothetical protein KF830_11320 [Planctomycetes bacterium]|nr:hypothetical protein [Planctomycetota bacterium]
MNIDPASGAAEDLLAALTVGDIGPTDPRVQQRFAHDPGLEARWRALAATVAELRATLTRADEPSAAGGDSIVDTLASVQAFHRGRRSLSRRRLLAFGIGAVATAAATWFWLPRAEVHEPPDPRLGPGATRLEPDGMPWAADAPLRWQAVRGAEFYRLDLRAVPDGVAVVVPGAALNRLEGTSWLPTAEVRSALPARFRWRVVAIDDSNVPLATSPWAETWQ